MFCSNNYESYFPLQIYKMEQEVDGIVLDPLKATHTIRKVTAHEMCHMFWDIKYRMDWDGIYALYGDVYFVIGIL